MKIGLVTDTSLTIPGGVQEYVRGLHDSLRERGEDVQIIASGAAGLEDKGRRVSLVGKAVELSTLHWRGAASSMPLNWARPSRLREFLKSERFDILHYAAPMSILGSQVLRASSESCPNTANVIAFLIYNETTPRVARLISPIFYQRLNQFVDARIAISQPAADYAQEFYPGQYTIIPCGIDTDRFNPGRGTIGAYADGKVNILFVGRLDARKNVLGMLNVYSRLKPNHPAARLIIVGDGPQRAEAEEFCRKRGLSDTVFVGGVSADDLPRYYNACDIFCAPTTCRESFGVVLVEAMACRKPVTGYANKGYHSVVEGSLLSSLLAEPMDELGLQKILETLIQDADLRGRMGDEGLKMARQKYSWETVSGHILAFYRQLRSDSSAHASSHRE